jgi:hypothetical protein
MPTLPDGSRTGKLGGWWLMLLLIVPAALVIFIPLALYVDPGEQRALNSPWTYVAATRGDQPLVLGAAWQKWLLPRFPPLRSQIGGVIALPQGGNPNELVFWHTSGSGAAALDQFVTMVDEQGRKTRVPTGPVKTPYVVHGWAGWGVQPGVACPISSFPRQGAQLQLRFEFGESARSGKPDLIISNPNLH